MRTLFIIIEMIAIIAGLLTVVGAAFYAMCWIAISAVQIFPLIGRRQRHPRWDELTKRSGRR
jgi:hypothetical protein